MKRAVIVEIVCFLFIVLFLYAGGSKLTEYYKFIGQMSKSPLITKYAATLAWMIPSIEIITAGLLIVPRTKLVGLYASFGLMTLFTFYISAILLFSDQLPCSCGGILSSLGWKEHLGFNLIFIAIAVIGIRMHERHSPRHRTVTG